jgi:hypothetical protein
MSYIVHNRKAKVVSENNARIFEEEINRFLEQDYKIISSYCKCFYEDDGFCKERFQAILYLNEVETKLVPGIDYVEYKEA